jgi:hypothetical protein
VIPAGKRDIDQLGSSDRHRESPGEGIPVLYVVPVGSSRSFSLLVAKNQRRNRLSRPLSTEKLCSADLSSRYTRKSRRRNAFQPVHGSPTRDFARRTTDSPGGSPPQDGRPGAERAIERDHGSLETGRRPLVRARRHRLEATCCATRSPSNGKEPDAQPNDQRTEP